MGFSENLKKVALSCVWVLSSCQRRQATSLTCFWYFIFALEKFILVASNYVKVWSLVSLVTSVVLGQVGPNGSPRVLSGVEAHSLCQSADQHHI